MRKLSQKVVFRREREADGRLATQERARQRETGHSALFQVLDREFESIAAYRPDRSRWDVVLAWLAQSGVTNARGNPVTAAQLATTWHQVRRARTSRGLRRRMVSIEVHEDGEEGDIAMSGTRAAGSARHAFSGAFAKALEEADRHSPLYLFLRENYDEILAHRPKHGGWHKFLAVVNETGILDGQGNVVTQRVLKRTWHKVSKEMLAARSRPAARVSPSPAPAQRFVPDPPVARAEPPPPQTFPVTTAVRKANSPSALPNSEEEEEDVTLTLEQAWSIQDTRNQLRVNNGRPAIHSLDNDLVNRLNEEALRTFIEAVKIRSGIDRGTIAPPRAQTD